MAAENGISKLRINPGNIGGEANVRMLADCARMHRIPIRIGVNSGSIEKDIFGKVRRAHRRGHGGKRPAARPYAGKGGLSRTSCCRMKASDVRLTVETYRLAAQRCDYPLHVGVTEAGLPGQGTIKSAIGIGSLLLDGIGDTIRVSLTGDPLPEAQAALGHPPGHRPAHPGGAVGFLPHLRPYLHSTWRASPPGWKRS